MPGSFVRSSVQPEDGAIRAIFTRPGLISRCLPLKGAECGPGQWHTVIRHALVFSVLILCLSLIVSCRRGAVEPLPTEPPTPTELVGGQPGATYAPVVTVTRFVPEPTPTSRCAPDPSTPTVQYDLDTTIDVDSHTLTAIMRAAYRNDTGQPLPQIVFNVEPNRKPDVFTLTNLEMEGQPPDTYTLTGPRLEVLLKSPLERFCRATVTLYFTIQVPVISSGFLGRGYFGYSDKQLNLGEWLPEIAPYVNGGWYTPRSWPIGEYSVSVMADFTAQVKVHGANQDKIEVIGPGQVEHTNGNIWRFKASGLRSFTLCLSTELSKLTATSDDGVVIDLYYFAKNQPAKAPDGSPISGPQHALETARGAVSRFTKMYGPLPYRRIVVVEGDFADGMEFSGMVFVGHDWFLRYDGKPDSWLTVITAHEVSHQWWYSLVGDDQGLTPYMDEALALYSELVYLEDRYPSLVPWWWQFRVKVYQPQGYVDSSVYAFQNLRLYIDAVYLRGALMFQEIREAIGDQAFYAWLWAYASVGAGKIATPVDLWQAMAPADYARTADIRAKYLRQPDPLHPPQPTPPATQPATVPATAAAVSRDTATPTAIIVPTTRVPASQAPAKR
jgi:hypothetical protein